MKCTILLATLASAAAFSVSPKQVTQATGVAAAITISTLSLSLSPNAAIAKDSPIEAGEQIFNANCAACHAGGQNVIMPDKTLEKEALETYLAGGRNEKSIVNQVTNGKNAMPAFGGRLDEDQINNVAAFVIATSESGWDE